MSSGQAEPILISLEQPPEPIKVDKVIGLVYAARPVSMTVAGVEEEIDALLARLREEAAKAGADAVLGVKIEVRRVAGAGIEWALLLAYGTAVKLA